MTRAAKAVDELIVGVLVNRAKIALLCPEVLFVFAGNGPLENKHKDLPNVRVESFHGLSVDFAKEQGAGFIVRGLRAITDFDYELQMAQTNRIMAPGVDTIFLTTNLEYAYLSSTTVKEVASYGGDITKFVPEYVAKAVIEKYQ